MLNSGQSFSEDTQEKVELFLGCRIPTSSHHFGHVNIKVKLLCYQNGKYNFFDETEVIKNNLSPDFTKTFVLNYYFETTQKLLFQIFQTDDSHHDTLIGEVSTTLGSIVGASHETMKKGLNIMHQGKETGKLVIKFEKITNNNNSALLAFQAQIQQTSGGWLQALDVFGLFSSDNYILKLYRITNDTDFVLIYESEIISHTSNPSWKQFDIKVSKLCNSDYFRPVKAQVCSRANTQDTLLGECQFTLDEVMNQNVKKFTLLHPASKKHTGTLNLSEFKLNEKANFLDYIKGGVQLNVMVGIDFTASNGDPDLDISLHSSRLGGEANEYQKAISSVCDILLNYDYDRRVLMFGFGGKPRYPNFRSNTVQHCFPLTGNPQDPWAVDLDGIMNAYNYALQNVELSGPTLFGPMLSEAMKVAQANKNNGSMEYTILLIITDGEIHDMESSINCLIRSADLPLSVIIVGVGSADFGNMDILDGDEGLYNSEGVKAQRDLVQFVPFRKFQHNAEGLAKHVLEEVPDQLVEYMTRVGIKPNAPQSFDFDALSAQMQNFAQENIQYSRHQSLPQPQGLIQDYNSQGRSQSQNYIHDYHQQIGSQSQIYDFRQQAQSHDIQPSQPLAPVVGRMNEDLYSSISVPRHSNLNFEQGGHVHRYESGEP